MEELPNQAVPTEVKKDRTGAIIKGVLLGVPCLAVLIVWLMYGDGIRAWWRYSGLQVKFPDKKLTELYEKVETLLPTGKKLADAPEPAARGKKCVWLALRSVSEYREKKTYASLDKDFGRLPPAACAENLDGVATVVLLTPSSPKVGEYVNAAGEKTGDAYDEVLEVMIVDLPNKKFLGRKQFIWKAQSKVGTAESGVRHRDSVAVVRWYMSLPEN